MSKKSSPADAELARRKALTFEQAEGAAELPSQLALGELSQQLRAVMWEVIHSSMLDSNSHGELDDPWLNIAYQKWVYRDHRMADDFSSYTNIAADDFKKVYARGNFVEVFGLTQWILRHENCPADLAARIQWALKEARAAYTLVDGDTIFPVSTPQEGAALQHALDETRVQGLQGAHAHLKLAADKLTEGDWAGSVRESIHAVEAAAKIIEPKSGTLGPALAALAKKQKIHGALQTGFSALYGFTSDAKGVRHSLLDKAEAEVDAVDAQYMLGACAAFVSYLLARARQ